MKPRNRLLRWFGALSVAALLLGGIAYANFVTSNSSLPPTKRDLTPLPPGADPTRYIAAADYNALMNAILDIRTAIINGSFLGFLPLASHPTPPVSGSAQNMWVRSSDDHLIYTSNGSDTDLSAGGGGGSGTVTSISVVAPLNAATITTTGTVGFPTEAAHAVLCGPATGSPATPTFRALQSSDIPSLSGTYLPLSGGTMSGAIAFSGTQTGTYSLGGTPTLAANMSVASGVDIVAAGGASDIDYSASSGVFKTPTGASTFGGSSNTFTNGVTLNGSTVSAGTGTDIPFDVTGNTADAITISSHFGDHLPSIWFDGTPGGTSSAYIFGGSGSVALTAAGARVAIDSTNGWFPSATLTTSLGSPTQAWSTVNFGHLAGITAAAPTHTAQAGLGTSPTVTITGSDTAMLITYTVGTGGSIPTGNILLVTYNTAYAIKPKAVQITPVNATAITAQYTAVAHIVGVDNDSASTTTTGFMLTVTGNAYGSTQGPYEFSATVIQ